MYQVVFPCSSILSHFLSALNESWVSSSFILPYIFILRLPLGLLPSILPSITVWVLFNWFHMLKAIFKKPNPWFILKIGNNLCCYNTCSCKYILDSIILSQKLLNNLKDSHGRLDMFLVSCYAHVTQSLMWWLTAYMYDNYYVTKHECAIYRLYAVLKSGQHCDKSTNMTLAFTFLKLWAKNLYHEESGMYSMSLLWNS